MSHGKVFQFRNELRAGDIVRIISFHTTVAHKELESDCSFEAYIAENLGRFAREDNPRSRIWITDDDQEIIGTIAVVDAGDAVAQLRWFAVHPRAAGKGIGKALLAEALEFCRQQRYREVFLWTVKGLEIARAMYDKSGFRVVEENTHKAWGKILTEQKMTLHLV